LTCHFKGNKALSKSQKFAFFLAPLNKFLFLAIKPKTEVKVNLGESV